MVVYELKKELFSLQEELRGEERETRESEERGGEGREGERKGGKERERRPGCFITSYFIFLAFFM